MTTKKIYSVINAVQGALSKVGVSKDQTNKQQGWDFRGIDNVMNTLSAILAEHGLCILPNVISRNITERISQKGGLLFYVTLEVEYHFVCSEDSSYHIVKVYGEAMDSGDKATNKALSVAYKYAAIQAFCIPIKGDDPDATAHEIVPTPAPKPIAPVTKSASPPLSGTVLALRQAIKKYNIPDAMILDWKACYNVATLADLSDKEAAELLADIHKLNANKIEVPAHG